MPPHPKLFCHPLSVAVTRGVFTPPLPPGTDATFGRLEQEDQQENGSTKDE
ncbi:MAG: hypothetical protein H0T91_09135 [Propionibacteriaceae bacterium]|nr:hypothetical protein [Propionibacteriaceae bacterium]